MRVLSVVAVAALAFMPADVGAQVLTLQARDGRVTLEASGVTVAQILESWAQLRGVKVTVRGGTLPDTLLTLRLDGVSEADALATLLRNVSGYSLTRQPDASGNTMQIDRIVILLSSSPATAIASTESLPAPAIRPAETQLPTTAVDRTSLGSSSPDVAALEASVPNRAEPARGSADPAAPAIDTGAPAPAIRLGIFSGEGPPNMPSSGDPSSNPTDLSRYADMMVPQPAAGSSPPINANPFGTRGAQLPGPRPGSSASPQPGTAPPTSGRK